ncbi:ABC transporter permease [Rhodococcus aerolatus]
MIVTQVLDFLTDGANYGGQNGIVTRAVEHLSYSLLAVAIAVLIALPVGALIGHTGRGATLVLGSATALRAIPSLGLVLLLVSSFSISLTWLIITLVVLAVPPVMLATLAGVSGVDPDLPDAARGVGMTEPQVLLRVELPNAMPVIFGGVRTAMLQVVATVPIAALVAQGTLGQYIVSGLLQRDVPQVVSGAVLIALLAVLVDVALAGLQRLVVPTGLRLLAGPRRRSVLSRRGPDQERTPA